MVFSFLRTVGDVARVAAPIAEVATGLIGAREQLRGPTPSPTLPQATAAAQRQEVFARDIAELSRQLLDPQSRIIADLAAQEEAALQSALAQDIAGLLRTQQRQQRLGRAPLFDVEREDELLSRLAQRGRVAARESARQRARAQVGQSAEILSGASRALTPAIQGLTNVGTLTAAERDASRRARLSGLGDISTILSGLAKNGPGQGQRVEAQIARPSIPRVVTGQSILNGLQEGVFDVPRISTQTFGRF